MAPGRGKFGRPGELRSGPVVEWSVPVSLSNQRVAASRLIHYQVTTMATRQTLPVLPLRGTVIFPGLTAPIAAGRPGTLRAIESALKGDRLVFCRRSTRQHRRAERRTSSTPMGVIARISQIQRGLGGVQASFSRANNAPHPSTTRRLTTT